MFGDTGGVQADLMACGNPLPPGSVGNAETVPCRGMIFWLYPQPGARFHSRCTICKFAEDLRIHAIVLGGNTVSASQRYDQVGAGGERVCGAVFQTPQPCTENRFRLLDGGNEIAAICVACGYREVVGFKGALK